MQTITRVFEGECINKPAERKFVSSKVFETYATGCYNLLDEANSCGLSERIIRYWIECDCEVAVCTSITNDSTTKAYFRC